jgi:hypothetical protein
MNIPKLLNVGEVMNGTALETSLIYYIYLFFHPLNTKVLHDIHEAHEQKLASLEYSLVSAQESREEILSRLVELEKIKYPLSLSLSLSRSSSLLSLLSSLLSLLSSLSSLSHTFHCSGLSCCCSPLPATLM